MQIDDILKENTALRAEIDELRKEIDRLRQIEMEVQGLRRVVFCRLHEDAAAESDDTIVFPYSVKKRIVIIGGHDSWNKVFRPMLKNVRFIDKEASVNADSIKRADVIWIQPNALGRMQYAQIMNVARSNRIEVKFFLSASAEKCARAVAMEDMQ